MRRNRARPYSRTDNIPPVGACFARPWNDRRSFPISHCRWRIPGGRPQVAPTARHQSSSRRGELCSPAERPQAVPYIPSSMAHPRRATTGRPYSRTDNIPPVGACFARPRNGRRPFPTSHCRVFMTQTEAQRHRQYSSRRGELCSPAERPQVVSNIPSSMAHPRRATTGRPYSAPPIFLP